MSGVSATRFPNILVKELGNQLKNVHRNKIQPIEDDYLFSDFFPKSVHSIDESHSRILVVTDCDTDSENVIKLVIGESSEPYPGISVFSRDIADNSVIFPVNDNKIFADIKLVRTGENQVTDLVTVIHSRFSEVLYNLIDCCCMVYLVFNVNTPDVPNKYRKIISKLANRIDNLRLVIISDSNEPMGLMALTWSLAKTFKTPEMPRTHIIHQGSNETIRQELMQVPFNNLLWQLVRLQSEAKRARAHALLLSQIKSQLPTFNRQAKQEKLVGELPVLIESVANKFGLAVNEFPSPDVLRDKLISLDFSKIKKIKENSLTLVEDFINSDFNRILSTIPHSEEDILLINMNSVDMNGMKESIKPPNLNDYVSDFKSLDPSEGFLSGSTLRDHLFMLSKLPSSTLHKIWKLADIDADGKLSLKEYAMARELIKWNQSGNEIPRKLPASFII
jgi:EH domain-containing protein 1